MWYAVQFYAEYCAARHNTEFVVKRLLDIVEHFPHEPQSGNRYRQRVAWACVQAVQDDVKESLSLALARQNYQDDPYLVAELAFCQSSKENAVQFALECVQAGYVKPAFFTCGCEECVDDSGWNNHSRRRQCLKDWETEIYNALQS